MTYVWPTKVKFYTLSQLCAKMPNELGSIGTYFFCMQYDSKYTVHLLTLLVEPHLSDAYITEWHIVLSSNFFFFHCIIYFEKKIIATAFFQFTAILGNHLGYGKPDMSGRKPIWARQTLYF